MSVGEALRRPRLADFRCQTSAHRLRRQALRVVSIGLALLLPIPDPGIGHGVEDVDNQIGEHVHDTYDEHDRRDRVQVEPGRGREGILPQSWPSNDVLNDEQRSEIANEIDQMLEAVFRISNTNREGEFIFSGTDKDTQTFEAIRDDNGEIIGINFKGNNEEREINIGLGEQVAKNIGGGITFQNPGGDVFKSLLNLRDNLRNGESLMMDIGDIRKALNFTLDQVTELNTRFQVLELARERLESSQIINRNLLSLTEDADLAQLLVDLTNHQNILQANLAVGARVIPPTLLQFI